MVGDMSVCPHPGPGRVPRTPLLEYFRSTFPKPRGKSWGAHRLSDAEAAIAESARLAHFFDESVKTVECEYRNYQPFYPRNHTFGLRGNTEIAHGDELQYTVDVAARLSKRKIWKVQGNSQLDFRYLDREIPLARAKPGPKQDPGSLLEVDLFLANAYDRTPILSEVKLKKDECPFYALIQLLTQAAYAATQSQRERLVLFGSRPDFVLRESIPSESTTVDLYVLLIDPPAGSPYDDLQVAAIELSKSLIADECVASRIGRIAWITGTGWRKRSLAFKAITVATSRRRSPRTTRVPPTQPA
jgi:hypothetical protein